MTLLSYKSEGFKGSQYWIDLMGIFQTLFRKVTHLLHHFLCGGN